MAGEVARGKYTHRLDFKRFAHNIIHDLESLWWIGVWCMMWHYPVPDDAEFDPSKRAHVTRMIAHGTKLFPPYNRRGNDAVLEEVFSPTQYRRRLVSSYPPHIRGMIARLERFRQCVSWAHGMTQKALPRDDVAYFASDLRSAYCGATEADDDEPEDAHGKQLSIFDVVIAGLERDVEGLGIPDERLWPLGSIDLHSAWVKEKTTPEPAALGEDCEEVNTDEKEESVDAA